MKKLNTLFMFTLILSIAIFKLAIALEAIPCAVNEPNCWKCGDDCSARLDAGGKMTINGSGEMYDYSWYWAQDTSQGNKFGTTAPWFSVMDRVTSAEISGVSTLGDATFLGFKNLTNINIDNSVTSIGNWALEDCNFSTIYIPSSVTTVLSSQTFTSNPNLTQIVVESSLQLPNSTYDSNTHILKYQQEGDLIYLYDNNNNIKGVFNNQQELRDVANGNGHARILYDEDNNFTIYDVDGDIAGKWTANGDIIARYIKREDGATAVYNAEGRLTGLKNARYITPAEAAALTNTKGNTVSITW